MAKVTLQKSSVPPTEVATPWAGRRWWPIWLIYLALLAVGIPWYWPRGEVILWLGLPAWVVTAVVASVAASVLTASLLRTPWPGESDRLASEAETSDSPETSPEEETS